MITLNRRTANRLRWFLDNWLPPIVREGWPFTRMVKSWLGSQSLPDFKERAFGMTDAQFAAAYRNISGAYTERQTDTTENQASWVRENIPPGRKILEIGPGRGMLTDRLIASGQNVICLDLDLFGGGPACPSVVGVAERLPFRDKSVDITIVCHVVEHVRSLTLTFMELERITRDRVLIVTPRQRSYKVTFDYHLQFFYSIGHLASHVHKGTAYGTEVDGDLCLIWNIPRKELRP